MCPNCFPGTNIEIGWIIAFAICIIFFAVAVVAMLIASKTGYLDNLEEAKFNMLED